MLQRILTIPKNSRKSFFLWGPRQVGKSFFLRYSFPDAYHIDLLKSENFIEFRSRPERLREIVRALHPKPPLVILDEVQKIPALLDEVQVLIEEDNLRFALCGSSARKLRRGHANLLGGRAIRYEMHGLVSAELSNSLDFPRLINHGCIPNHYLDDNPKPLLRSYVSDYLKEEIFEEGLVRDLPKFARFLEVAAISDTQILNASKTAEDCLVTAPTIKDYYSILEDTLLGRYLKAYSKNAKRKVTQSPKFYLFDVGVVQAILKRNAIVLGTDESGPAFENWLHHEITAYSHYSDKHFDIAFWRLADHAATEVDFILGNMEIAIECKTTKRAGGHHLRSLHEIKREYPKVKRRILVCFEKTRRITDEHIEIIPVQEFVKELWAGEIL